MQQTLFRIQLDSLLGTRWVDDIFVIGIGWMAIPWLLLTAYWYLRAAGRHFEVPESDRADAVRTERRALRRQGGIGLVILVVIHLLSRGGPDGPTIPVFGYGFLVFLGCIGAGKLGVHHARRAGIPEQLVWDLAIWLFVSGVVGARGWYVLQYRERLLRGKDTLIDQVKALLDISSGGLVLYGGVGLALVAIVIFAQRHKHICPPLKLLDLILPSFFLALACGRLGCLMNGCCWGDACELPWAIRFPHGSVPFNALAARGFVHLDASATMGLHPSQVYSAFNGLVLCLVTASLFRHSRRPGQTTAIALVVYPITRFLLEILRGDEMGQFGTSLTISQCFSLLLFAIGLGFVAWLSRHATLSAVES
tara:strand:+ start:2289 stop:3383 length:1095 start_codon:yes stop_codon:yes gene_type:complete